MIALTESQYAAIGRVAVQSGTLEREVSEYITGLGGKPKGTLGPKLGSLRNLLLNNPSAKEFDFVLDAIDGLIDKRNTVVHGVWSKASNAPIKMGDMKTTGRLTLHASEVDSVASYLRLARKLLLVLCHDHCPAAAGRKKRPKASAAKLKVKLAKVSQG